MRKKLKLWWVVATHKRGTVRMEECNKLGMTDFMEWHTAARVFTYLSDARGWISMLKRNNDVPEGIKLRVLSNEAWEFVGDMYYNGRRFEQGQL